MSPLALRVAGPFTIPYAKGAPFPFDSATITKRFWSSCRVARKKRGCYVMATRAGKGFTPWYVGKAGSTAGFGGEVFTCDKLLKYQAALTIADHGTPVLFFVAPNGSKNMVPGKMLKEVERELIRFACAKNPELLNKQNAKSRPGWYIQGVLWSPPGKPSTEAMWFSRMLGIAT